MKLGIRKKSGIITATLRTPQGRRTVSTGCTDMAEAKALVKESKLETIEMLSRAGELTQQLIEKLTIGGSMTVCRAIEQWRVHMVDSSMSEVSSMMRLNHVKVWARESGCNGGKLCHVSERHLSEWINAPDGTKLGTRTNKLMALRSFFSFCSLRNYLNPNPARAVSVKTKLLSHEQKEPRAKVPFTDDEVQKIIDYLTMRIVEYLGAEDYPRSDWNERRFAVVRFWYCATVLARHTGMRLGDICRLEWASLEQQPGRIIVWTQKKGVRIDLEVNEEMARAIAYIRRKSKTHCFPEQRDLYNNVPESYRLSKQFEHILLHAGVVGHSFHDFRHTRATELSAGGMTIEKVAQELGHGSTKSTQGYIHEATPQPSK